MIQISFKLTEQELYKGLVETSRSRLVSQLLRGLGFIVLAVIVFFTTSNIKNGTFYFSFGYVFCLLASIYMIFISEITSKFQTSNLIKTRNAYSEQIQVKVTHNHIHFSGDKFSTKLTWDKVLEVVETSDFFLLKTSEGIANPIPKRAFSANELAEFKTTVSNSTGLKLKLA
jgi:hypothetical protein